MKLEVEESWGNFEFKCFVSLDSNDKGKEDGYLFCDIENGIVFLFISFNLNWWWKSLVFWRMMIIFVWFFLFELENFGLVEIYRSGV